MAGEPGLQPAHDSLHITFELAPGKELPPAGLDPAIPLAPPRPHVGLRVAVRRIKLDHQMNLRCVMRPWSALQPDRVEGRGELQLVRSAAVPAVHFLRG